MILIVEDEALYRRSIGDILVNTGFQMDFATDGYQALKYLEEKEYTLAVIDLVLPGPLNGLDVIKKIKLHTPSTRVIAISGYGNQSLIQKTYKAGADIFIPKPFKPGDLIDQVNKLLSRKIELPDAVEEAPVPVQKEPVFPQENTPPKPVSAPPPPKPPVRQMQPQAIDDLTFDNSRIDMRTIPEIFNGFPKKALLDIIQLGEIYTLKPPFKQKINFTETITTVISGQADCWFQDRYIGILNEKESLGQESLTKDINPNALLIVEARTPLKLFVIPKINLIKYLHKHIEELLGIFKSNLKLTLSNNIIIKAAQNPNVQLKPPKPANS